MTYSPSENLHKQILHSFDNISLCDFKSSWSPAFNASFTTLTTLSMSPALPFFDGIISSSCFLYYFRSSLKVFMTNSLVLIFSYIAIWSSCLIINLIGCTLSNATWGGRFCPSLCWFKSWRYTSDGCACGANPKDPCRGWGTICPEAAAAKELLSELNLRGSSLLLWES